MTMLADTVDAVVGVDTHRDTHTAHLLDSAGRSLGARTVANSTAGFTELIDWVRRRIPFYCSTAEHACATRDSDSTSAGRANGRALLANLAHTTAQPPPSPPLPSVDASIGAKV